MRVAFSPFKCRRSAKMTFRKVWYYQDGIQHCALIRVLTSELLFFLTMILSQGFPVIVRQTKADRQN